MSSPGPATPARGSQRALRRANEQQIVALLAQRGVGTSQAEISRRTGLSAATVSTSVRRLVSAGALELRSGTSNGRRSSLVELSPGRPVGGVDVGRTHVRVVVRGPDRAEGTSSADLPTGHGPGDARPVIRACLEEASMRADVAVGDVAAIGVGLPGPIDTARGCVTGGSILPAWVGVAVGDVLGAELGAPVLLDNDANLGARAAAAEHGVTGGTLVYVKVGSGVGAGILVDGVALRGRSGLAGEIGHMSAVDGGTVCRCGRRGCLETLASAERVRLTLEEILDRQLDLEALVELAQAQEPVVLRVLEGAGEAIGRCLADVCALLDPGMIVVGGPLARTGDALLGPIDRSFRRHSLPGIASTTRIYASRLGDRAEALGALDLARLSVAALS